MGYKSDPALIPRMLTAALLAPAAVFGVLYLSTPWFALAFALVLLFGTWEWTKIVGLRRNRFRGSVVLAIAGLLAAIWFALPHKSYGFVAGTGVAWWCVSVLWLRRFNFANTDTLENAEIKVVVGSLLMVPAFAAAVLLHESAHGPRWTLFVFVLIWAADIGAYFVGRRFGSKKLAPQISPGKTREGAYGGLVMTALVALASALFLQLSSLHTFYLVLLAVITVMFSIIGDLFESLMKRHANLKDSGTLLPGHGGVLDRIDSLLAALPVFAFGKLLLAL